MKEAKELKIQAEKSLKLWFPQSFGEVALRRVEEHGLNPAQFMNEVNRSSVPEVIHFAKMFKYKHLPQHLQAVSKNFHDLFVMLALTVPNGYEKSAMMRKLREAKDCAVTAFVS